MAEADPDYAMGYLAEETRRLIAQSRLYTPFTRQLFIEAGIGRGMRVLDVESGAGDVALLAAELIGSGGRVVGADSNGAILGVARARALRFGNIEFVATDIRDLAVERAFDAVLGRFIPIHPDDGIVAIGVPGTTLACARDARSVPLDTVLARAAP